MLYAFSHCFFLWCVEAVLYMTEFLTNKPLVIFCRNSFKIEPSRRVMFTKTKTRSHGRNAVSNSTSRIPWGNTAETKKVLLVNSSSCDKKTKPAKPMQARMGLLSSKKSLTKPRRRTPFLEGYVCRRPLLGVQNSQHTTSAPWHSSRQATGGTCLVGSMTHTLSNYQ